MEEKVQILLSLYKPNKTYLIKQLQSLNNQSYNNQELLIFDDGPESEKVDQNLIKEIVSKYPVRFLPNLPSNLGYTKAFEYLINNSDGKYLAFCDQDDIWDSEKVKKCVHIFKKEKSLLVTTDRKIIDENDIVKVESVHSESNKYYENWRNGDDICSRNLFICFAPGMSIMVDGDFARNRLPISNYTGHDKWFLACASAENGVCYLDETLVSYRRHGKNVSGFLQDIETKDDYFSKRILAREGLIKDFLKVYPNYKDKNQLIDFIKAQKEHNIIKIWKYKNFAKDIAKFDIVMNLLPKFIFNKLIILYKKNR